MQRMILPLVFISLFWLPVQAQVTDSHDVSFTIPEIALLDIEPGNAAITVFLQPPTEAGAPLEFTGGGTDNSKWLNYSSALAPAAPGRTVSVQITDGSLPAGVEVKVQAASYSGSGAGAFGTPAGLISLSSTAQTLISSIGRCYTDNGQGNGH
ncbi:MAG: hypothetical protein HY842_14640, partial [Bacteroidetes bacterium]|nr:hypothetical protein [Bacteroidota bacterium]